jgi:hypothetical protein
VLWLQESVPVGPADDERSRDAAECRELLRATGFNPHVVVVDHCELGLTWEDAWRSSGAFVAALDDMPNRPHSADLVVELLPGTSADPQRIRGLQF